MTTQTETKSENEVELQIANAVLFGISIYKFGDKVGGDSEEVETSADKDMLKIQKTLFKAKDADGNNVKIESWEKVKSTYAKLYNEITRLSMPVYLTDKTGKRRMRRNIRIINASAIPKIEKVIADYEKLGQGAVEEFLKVYPNLIELAKEQLKGQYKESDYPTPEYIKSRFGVAWSFFPFGTPSNLPKEVLEREMKATIENNKATAQECRIALRTGLLNLVEHMEDMLKPDDAGRQKKFHASNISKIVEFGDLLEIVDVTSDIELANIAQKARILLEGATVKEIRGKLKDEVEKGLNSIKSELSAMVSTVGKRVFKLDDDKDSE